MAKPPGLTGGGWTVATVAVVASLGGRGWRPAGARRGFGGAEGDGAWMGLSGTDLDGDH